MQKACFHAMVIETTAEADFTTRNISLSNKIMHGEPNSSVH